MQTGSSFKGIPLRHRDKDLPGVTILDASKPRKQKISGVDDGHFDVSGILEPSKFHRKIHFDVLRIVKTWKFTHDLESRARYFSGYEHVHSHAGRDGRVRVTCSFQEDCNMTSVEDLDVFKLGHQLALKTYATTKKFPKELPIRDDAGEAENDDLR